MTRNEVLPSSTNSKFSFFTTCVDIPDALVHCEGGLVDMIETCEDVSRNVFLRYVGRKVVREVEVSLGYETDSRNGLTMADDWHVSYHRGRLMGQLVYFFRWSAIEHIFVRSDFFEKVKFDD